MHSNSGLRKLLQLGHRSRGLHISAAWHCGSPLVICRIDVAASTDEGDWSPPEFVPDDVRLDRGENSGGAKLWGSLAAVGGLAALIMGSIVFKDQLAGFLTYFTDIVDDMGPAGYVLYFFVYAGLEILAVPAIPLTMASGAIFGIIPGSILVSLAGTTAAAVSFLIARYVARDKVSRSLFMHEKANIPLRNCRAPVPICVLTSRRDCSS